MCPGSPHLGYSRNRIAIGIKTMRYEKFTTRLQEALAEAQSNALGQDHQYMEPQHLLAALLTQEDGGVAGLISKAGGNPNALKKALSDSIARLPKVEGTPGEVMVSRDLAQLLNVADKEAQKRGDQYIASELFLLAAAADKGETGRILKSAGVAKQSLEKAIEQVRGGEGPRRVRGAPQIGAAGAGQGRGQHHRLHRRAAYHGWRGKGRGRDRRGQHAEAGPGARRAALHRRHHARRIPQVPREGRRARAPLPEGAGRRAERRGDHRHPARAAGALRGPPRRRDHRPGDRRRGRALAALHHRPLPSRQGDRPDRRGGGAHQDGGRLETRGARPPGAAPDPAENRKGSGEEGEGRSLTKKTGPHRKRNRPARQGIRRPGGRVEGGEGRAAGHPAHQGGDREAQAADGRGAPQGRLAEDVRDPVRKDSTA